MKNILVVDDNMDILEAVSTLLHERVKGCAVSIATDGAQGEAIMKSTPVDLVLTDLSMPVMNGYMLIERVRKKYPAVLVCVMTADCSPRVISKLLSMGVGRWIEKPFKFEKLARMIAEELDIPFSDRARL